MIEQAAYWAAQLATDEATQDDHDACETWCREHPLHRLAMDRMRGFDAQFNSADDIGRETIETVLERRSRKVRWFGGLMAGLVFLIGGGQLAIQSLTVKALFPDYQTERGEQRTVKLADGSGLSIDTGAALDFHRGAKERKVTLFHGQILVRVAADASHPFIVET
jgi:transmembrane sensor